MSFAQRCGRAVGALAAAAVLVIALPWALISASSRRFGSANPLDGLRPPWSWRADEINESVRRPLEDDTVVDVILRSSLLVAWVMVALIAITTVLEVAHLLRHRGVRSARRRGLGWAQPIARFIAAGLIAMLPLSATVAIAQPLAPLLSAPSTTAFRPSNDATQTNPASTMKGDLDLSPTIGTANDSSSAPAATTPMQFHERTPRAAERIHVVARGDSVWSIAAAIGGGDDTATMRLAERILDRNLGHEMNDGTSFTSPALIQPGWELLIPTAVDSPVPADDAPATSAIPTNQRADDGQVTTHVVGEGDTLSTIAELHLGSASEWTSIADDHLGSTMTDGRVFDDPDLILPGWEFEVDAASLDAPGTIDGPDQIDATDQVDATDQIDSTDQVDASDQIDGPDQVDLADHLPADDGATSDVLDPDTDWFDDRPDDDGGDATTPVPTVTPSTTSTTSTVPSAADAGRSDPTDRTEQPATAPSTLGIEHAGMLAGGLLTLAAVRRRRRLRAAQPRARLPEPHSGRSSTERILRTLGGAERRARLHVAVRAASRHLVGSGSQPIAAVHELDGRIELVVTRPAPLPPPWTAAGDDQISWHLSAAVPLELLADDARSIGEPCPLLVAVGQRDGADIFIELEAAGITSIETDAGTTHSDELLRSIAATVATSVSAETAHLLAVGLDATTLFGHPNAESTPDGTTAIRLAAEILGPTATGESTVFDLRARRTGGEAWEPALVVVDAASVATIPSVSLPDRGRGLAMVLGAPHPDLSPGARLRPDGSSWRLETGGWSTSVVPFGLTKSAVSDLVEFVEMAGADAITPPTVIETTVGERANPEDTTIDSDQSSITDVTIDTDDAAVTLPAVEAVDGSRYSIVVGLFGGVTITDRQGNDRAWQRSKTVELIAWMATHRSRSTRSAARTAMWEHDVRDATFSNIVSEARRGLASLVAPPEEHEWIPRTHTDDLPLHDEIVTDLDLIAAALEVARLAAPAEAVAILRPVVERVGGLPFADTEYLWPDADGLVTNAILVATSACVELAQHSLSLGDIDGVFAATGHALRVLPGHEESIALRMRAHGQRGNLAGVREEWESYERVLTADAWSDGEPAPELLALRRELLAR